MSQINEAVEAVAELNRRYPSTHDWNRMFQLHTDGIGTIDIVYSGKVIWFYKKGKDSVTVCDIIVKNSLETLLRKFHEGSD
jgi:hypothetical protein